MSDTPSSAPSQPGRVVFEEVTFRVIYFGGIVHQRYPVITGWPSQRQPATKGHFVDEQL